MSQYNVDKQTMQKHHQDAANFHKNDKHVEGHASAHKAHGHSSQAEQHTSEAPKHGAGIPSSKGTLSLKDKQ